jgi:hypothetical protein
VDDRNTVKQQALVVDLHQHDDVLAAMDWLQQHWDAYMPSSRELVRTFAVVRVADDTQSP